MKHTVEVFLAKIDLALDFRGSVDILVGTNSQDSPDDGGQPATYGLSDITVVCIRDGLIHLTAIH